LAIALAVHHRHCPFRLKRRTRCERMIVSGWAAKSAAQSLARDIGRSAHRAH
jgi:hypothetical protein